VPPHWVPYFGVESLEASIEKLGSLGGQALAEPQPVPGGRFVPAMDAHGAAFSMWEGDYDPPPGA
jgi:predicted enzyme related to lactoylglutathione lyase